MKNPLHYQLSEYDCGPTTMLNAVSYLFEREEIPPELIRNVMLYSLDCYGKGGAPCKAGTSRMAMMFLANWLDGYGQATSLPLSSIYLSGQAVSVRPESRVLEALHRGGVAVVWGIVSEYYSASQIVGIVGVCYIPPNIASQIVAAAR